MMITYRVAQSILSPRHRVWRIAVSLLAASIGGCRSLTDQTSVPSGVVDPATYHTPAGARALYRRSVIQFERAHLASMEISGALTDELRSDVHADNYSIIFDERALPENDDFTDINVLPLYSSLQLTRTYGREAFGALGKYDPEDPPSLRAQVLAQNGYAEILLADLFCSGVPLSELEFEGDFVYKAGSTTAQVYAHAITLFDSAEVLAAGNDSVLNFARVGKGRALLSLDSVDAAARAVIGVPDNFAYRYLIQWCGNGCDLGDTTTGTAIRSKFPLRESVSDREGTNGLPYLSDNDPRTRADSVPTPLGTGGSYVTQFPGKYGPLVDEPSTNPQLGSVQAVSTSPVVVASGIEAQLIRAEAALRSGDVATWLGLLNTLRTTCTTRASCVAPAPAGSGGVAGLPPLDDPGTPRARVDLMFSERAAWLFVTATRQGDLRRLIRYYGRTPAQVYPVGSYVPLNPAYASRITYGADITLPVPQVERRNQLFSGCYDRGA